MQHPHTQRKSPTVCFLTFVLSCVFMFFVILLLRLMPWSWSRTPDSSLAGSSSFGKGRQCSYSRQPLVPWACRLPTRATCSLFQNTLQSEVCLKPSETYKVSSMSGLDLGLACHEKLLPVLLLRAQPRLVADLGAQEVGPQSQVWHDARGWVAS